MTQYGYGYGYQQPYGYSQVAATPAAAYSAYQQQQRVAYPGVGQTTQPTAQPSVQQQQHHHQQTLQSTQQQQQHASQHHQPQQQQQPSVGYSPYTAAAASSAASVQQQQQQLQARPTQMQQYHQAAAAAAAAASQQQAAVAPKPAPPPAPPGTSQVSASPSYYTMSQQQQQTAQAQQTQTAGYYGYGGGYRPQASSYTPYYGQQQQQQQSTQATAQHQRSQGQHSHYQSSVSTVTGSGMTGAMRRITPASNTTSQYATASSGTAAVGGGGASMVTYPAYTPTNYFPSYNKQKTATTGTGVGGATSTLTSQQQHVVASYIQQKNKPSSAGTPNFFAKRTVANPQQYYCEVCKISCVCAATYQTHLDGKNHKKRLQQQQSVPMESKKGENYCELCDVVCSNKDAFEAHLRGSKHQKVLTLHRRLGKPIPQMNVGGAGQAGGKTVMVTAPRITFVGGKQLHSTGQTNTGSQEQIKVYPPTAPVVATPTTPKTTPTPSVQTTPTMVSSAPVTPSSGLAQQTTPTSVTPDESLAEPVGEQFVVMVKGDPKVPHATYKCELCDCYFNDDYAKKMHVKGRRHRLNFKKSYQPDLYVEPTKAQKKEMEKKRMKRISRNSMEGPPPGGFKPPGGGMHSQPQISLGELRRQEALELAKRHQQQMATEDFSRGSGGGGSPSTRPPFPQETSPHIPMYPPDEGMGWYGPPMPMYPPAPPRPHNPRDDKLVLSKHSAIYPVDSEMKAVEAVLVDIEKALKQLSDDLLTEACKTDDSTEVKKDESLRELKGAYRVGTHAVGLLLRGECAVELVLMCANKPTHQLFNEVASRLPAKFENFTKNGESENVYNITPEPHKASLIIISQVGDHRIQVTVTLTSKKMREEGEDGDEPTTTAVSGDSDAGVLDSVPCLAALAALRHTTWFKTAAASLPSCTINLRVLKDICRRVPAWGVLDSWTIELLVPKCIRSANPDYTKPGDVFRRVMECVASGLFLPGGTGLSDPCENGVVDASAKLTAQERANITLSAQHALRLIAFGKLHLVLGVDPLPPPGTHRPRPSYKPASAEESPKGEPPASSENAGANGGGDGGDEVKASAGVKREPSQDGDDSSEVKKIKLES